MYEIILIRIKLHREILYLCRVMANNFCKDFGGKSFFFVQQKSFLGSKNSSGRANFLRYHTNKPTLRTASELIYFILYTVDELTNTVPERKVFLLEELIKLHIRKQTYKTLHKSNVVWKLYFSSIHVVILCLLIETYKRV